MVPAVDEVQQGLGAERLSSPNSNALAAWRFEPCLTFNDKSNQGGWITQSWQRHEMESLTMALGRELSSASSTTNNNNNEKKKMLQVSDSSMASSGLGFNALLTPPAASSSSRHLDAVGSTVTSYEADTTPTISHFVDPDGSNGVHGIVGLGNQLSSNGSRASPVLMGNKSHQLSTINGGKVSKTRRSRASSKSPVTFLTADPENFRAMVQQVTGIPPNPTATTARLWSPSGGIGVRLPRRDFSSAFARNNIQGLPTLDTSSLRIDMSQDRLLAPQGTHSYNSLQISNPIHDPLIKSDVPFCTGDLLTENLRSACVQPWMEMGGSLPFPMSNLDVDGWKEAMAFNHSQRQQ